MAGTKPGIEVEGGPQLRRAFKKLGDRAEDLKELHGDIGSMVADTARHEVPDTVCARILVRRPAV